MSDERPDAQETVEGDVEPAPGKRAAMDEGSVITRDHGVPPRVVGDDPHHPVPVELPPTQQDDTPA